MRERRFAVSVVLLSLSFSFLCAQPSRCQDLEPVLERILNPVPDYDPFEKPLASPQFFPDSIDKKARELLIDALTNQKESLNDHLKFLKEEDSRLRKQYKTTTGLTEHAQDLVNNTIQDRERYLKAQKEALKTASSPERKKYLESIINHDDLNQADQLMRQSSSNQWGGLLNRMLSSLDLVGIVSGNYIGAAAETVVSQLYSLANRDMSIEQRRALVRHLDHTKRFPNDPRNAEIRKQLDKLETTKKNALVKKQINKAEEALGQRDLDRASFHAELAAYISPILSKEAQKIVQKVSKLQKEQYDARQKGLAARPEKPLSTQQETDVRQLLSALSLRDPVQIERTAIDVEKKNRGTAITATTLDAEAVAMEIRGRHDVAKKLLEQLARSSSNPEMQKRAAALLQSPDYNLLDSFNQARGERRLDSIKYVVLGDDLLKKNLLYAAGAVAAAGPAGAVTLGAVNSLMVGNNLINVLTNNPISAQPVIDAGVAYIRSHPQSESTSEVYKVLADAYEERGMFDKAINFHELAGTPQEKIVALQEKAAKTLLNAAVKSQNRGTQETYLTTVIDNYPDSVAASEATKKLAALAKSDNQGLRMSKQFLMENPEIYGPLGLGLKASLFDGNPQNMELADRGVNLLDGNELLVYYQTPWGVRSQSYPIAKTSADRFFATLRQKNHQIALADANQRAKGTAGGIRNLPTQILQGSARSGVEKAEDNQDTTFSLVREAAGQAPSHQRVLDHELLSDNERDPGSKYKLPPLQGTVSASRFSMTGTLPTGLWGNQIALGGDHRSPFAGLQLPLPLLEGFIPVDFMVQGRPGGFSVYPRIHTGQDKGEDPELYR